jgi:hypothetical protein
VVLVVGAGGPVARAAALRLAASGAAVVAAGPDLASVLETAGHVAATGGVVRVVEEPAPPLSGPALVSAAAAALEPPTDAVVSPEAFRDRAHAAAEVDALRRALAPAAVVLALATEDGAVAEAERVATAFLRGRPGDTAASAD